MTLGRLLYIVALGHTTVSFIAYRRAFAEMLRAGFVGTVGVGLANLGGDLRPPATACFFLIMAPFLGLVGFLLDRATLSGDRTALRGVAGWMVVVGLLAALVAPLTPFWLLPAFGCYLWKRAGSLADKL